MSDKPKKKTSDDIMVAGQKIGTAIQSWIQWGNERTFIVRSKDGQELVSLPLTAVVVVGVVGVFFVLPLTILLAILSFIMRLRFEIVSFANDSDDTIVYPDRLSQPDKE